MIKQGLAVALHLFAIGCHAEETEPTFLIKGKARSCQEVLTLDRAYEEHDMAFFSGWSSDDFKMADNWSFSCQQSNSRRYSTARNNQAAPMRYEIESLVQMESDRERKRAQKELDDAEFKAVLERQTAEDQRLADERAQILKPNYPAQLRDAQYCVKYNEALIAREKEIYRAVGVRDMATAYAAGASLVSCRHSIVRLTACIRARDCDRKIPPGR